MGTIAVVAAAGLAMVFFVALVDLVLIQYARGISQMAVDEAVREASVAVVPDERCRSAGSEILGDLLGGPIGADLELRCETDASQVTAIVDGRLRVMSPFVPDVRIEHRAQAVIG